MARRRSDSSACAGGEVAGRFGRGPSRGLTVWIVLVGVVSVASAAEVPVRVVLPSSAASGATLRLTGSVTAERSAQLSPRVSGLVAVVHVDAGDHVEPGAVLLELDRDLAVLGRRRAQAALDEARARLAEAERLRQEAVQLVADRHIPQTEARSREANVKLNAAVVARLEAEAGEQAEISERHSVVAPFAGVISRRLTEAGEWVQTGTPVLELVSIERLRLDVQVPQERYAQIDTDTKVEVSLDGLPDRFPGQVVAKVPVNDPGARTFLVRVVLEDPNEQMIPGMSAQASFELRGGAAALTVPRDALVRGPDGEHRVWVVEQRDGESLAFAREVQIGRSLGESVEVSGGIDGQALIVVRGNETLREAQAVRILDEKN